MLLCLIALYLEVRILIECYGENKKSRSQNDKRPSKHDDAARGNLSKLSREYKKFRLPARNLNRCKIVGALVLHQVRNLSAKLLYSVLKLFGFTHGARMTPNDPSSAKPPAATVERKGDDQ